MNCSCPTDVSQSEAILRNKRIQRQEPIGQLTVNGQPPLLRMLRFTEIDVHAEYPMGFEPGVDRQQIVQGSDEQERAAQQDEGKSAPPVNERSYALAAGWRTDSGLRTGHDPPFGMPHQPRPASK